MSWKLFPADVIDRHLWGLWGLILFDGMWSIPASISVSLNNDFILESRHEKNYWPSAADESLQQLVRQNNIEINLSQE